ncbi:hypothetical protein U1701_17640 [Sphingomonas sp. PB2P19]
MAHVPGNACDECGALADDAEQPKPLQSQRLGVISFVVACQLTI